MLLTQKAIVELFNVEQPAIAKHLINIYNEKELDKDSTYSKMELVQKEENRSVKRNVEFYNLDAIISVGYRVNSLRATQFRRWATYILKEFSKKGYIIDKKEWQMVHFLMKIIMIHYLLKISHEIACDKALTEFEKYRVKQDKLYKSDFDVLIEETNK